MSCSRQRALVTSMMAAAVLVAMGAVVPVLAPTAAAQVPAVSPPPIAIEVQALFAEATATVGDRVHLAVLVTHPEEVVVTVQRPILPNFDYISSSDPEVQLLGAGIAQTTVTFTLQVFMLGETALAPVTVNWVTEEGLTGSTSVASPSLAVAPTRAPDDRALRPAPPPLSIEGAPAAWLRPAAYAAMGVLILGGLVALEVAWRRRRSGYVALSEGGVMPEQTARERLAAVRGLALEEDAAFQHYYGTIAQVVRAFLSERFDFNAAALTTAELEQRMRSHGVDRWQARLVSGLLDRCDRAVYARQYPDPASADHDLTVAYEIVELSRTSTGVGAPLGGTAGTEADAATAEEAAVR